MQPTPSADPREYEHVYLFSEELEDVEPKTIDAELEQRSADSYQRLSIFNGTYLGVRRDDVRKGTQEYWLNLAFLDPKPLRRPARFWSAFVVGSGIGIIGVLGLVNTLFSVPDNSSRPLIVPLMAIATLVSLIVAVVRFLGTFAFFTQHGRIPVLFMSSDKPNRRQVRLFIKHLGEAARRARACRTPVRGHYLRDEMKEHRRLQEDGVLEAGQFETARALILKAHD
jgi:hypothetical protein